MRKTTAALLTLTLSLLSITSVTAATKPVVKVGGLCKKTHQVQKVGNKLLQCTGMDGKNTWQLSVAEIQKSVWLDMQSLRSAQKSVSTSLEVYYSPTVNKTIAKSLLAGVDEAARLWQVQYLPEKPLPTLFFSEKDRAWFIAQMKSLGVYSEHQLANFDDEVKRNGDHANWAGVTGDGGRLWMVYMIGSGKTAPDNNDYQVAAHEYTHLAQFQVANKAQEQLACWQIEGGAFFYGMYLGAANTTQLKDFIKERLYNGGFNDFPGLTKDPKGDWEKYLDKFGPKYDNTKCGPNGAYAIGSLAHEYLYSLKGHAGIIALLQNVANNEDFYKGFEQTYGKPWPVIRKEIAQYIKVGIAQIY